MKDTPITRWKSYFSTYADPTQGHLSVRPSGPFQLRELPWAAFVPLACADIDISTRLTDSKPDGRRNRGRLFSSPCSVLQRGGLSIATRQAKAINSEPEVRPRSRTTQANRLGCAKSWSRLLRIETAALNHLQEHLLRSLRCESILRYHSKQNQSEGSRTKAISYHIPDASLSIVLRSLTVCRTESASRPPVSPTANMNLRQRPSAADGGTSWIRSRPGTRSSLTIINIDT